MDDQKQFYITTAIFYPNGQPHIGHGYELIATDAIARFKRLDGYEVLFVSGTDEHGQKMDKTAREAGITALELADKNAAVFVEMTKALNASNDDFIRTTEERHKIASQEIWRRMQANGDIYKDRYSGWYSVRDEAYYDESETELRGDKIRYGPQGSPVEWVEEESYFFKLSSYGARLLKHYEENPQFMGPESSRKEILSFIKTGLRDLSISRTTFKWGIEVPDDPDHVMYVWVDALTNYITATHWPEGGARSKFWPADVHIIGKDITRFHAIYWPAFLMSAGLELPKRVYSHGFLFNSGEKMSKSVGNVVDPFSLAETYGVDQLRYFLLREIPFGRDGSYSHEAIVNRVNADLANDLGNLAQRSLSMIGKNCDAQVPSPGEFTVEDKVILDAAYQLVEICRPRIDNQKIHRALDAIWKLVADTNRYFAAQEPWALKKTDPERMQTVLYTTAEAIRCIGILAQPFIPDSASKLLNLLSNGKDARQFEFVSNEHALVPGTVLPAPKGVFPRIVETDNE